VYDDAHCTRIIESVRGLERAGDTDKLMALLGAGTR
jgi:hypothetical protein